MRFFPVGAFQPSQQPERSVPPTSPPLPLGAEAAFAQPRSALLSDQAQWQSLPVPALAPGRPFPFGRPMGSPMWMISARAYDPWLLRQRLMAVNAQQWRSFCLARGMARPLARVPLAEPTHNW
jgi:hypothetical protein